MSESMIERVARAIAQKDAAYRHWRDLDAASRIIYLGLARAAIEAMREPTDAMVRVGRKKISAGHGQAGIYTGDAYTAMIDAALNEHASR